jgi:hypothetical protein
MTVNIYRRPAREWPIPPMDKAAGWKDSAFTWAMGRLILQRIADGDTMKAITADPRMPAYCTVFRWMQVAPDFGDAVRTLRVRLGEARRAERDQIRASKGPKRRSGRKSTYTPRAARAVLRRIEGGASLSEVVREAGMPSFKAFYAWMRDRPALRTAYMDACRSRDLWLELDIQVAIDDVFTTGIPAANARIRALEGRRGRLTPKLYRPAPRPC